MLTPESERDVWYANRMLVLLRPRPPFLRWVDELVRGESDEQPNPEPIPFLVPLFDYWEDAERWVQDHHALIFETVLWSWSGDPSTWPSVRSWEEFADWFDLELLNAPWDVVSAPLHSDPPPPDDDWN